MQQIRILCIGKAKDGYLRDACADYARRLTRYCRLEITELADEPCPERLSEKERLLVLEKEGKRLLEAVSPGEMLVALDIGGREMSSEDFSDLLKKTTFKGESRLAFAIGGSLGLSPAVLARSSLRLSFSPMTFPHGLARLLLLEQIYRGFKIERGEPYHK